MHVAHREVLTRYTRRTGTPWVTWLRFGVGLGRVAWDVGRVRALMFDLCVSLDHERQIVEALEMVYAVWPAVFAGLSQGLASVGEEEDASPIARGQVVRSLPRVWAWTRDACSVHVMSPS